MIKTEKIWIELFISSNQIIRKPFYDQMFFLVRLICHYASYNVSP